MIESGDYIETLLLLHVCLSECVCVCRHKATINTWWIFFLLLFFVKSRWRFKLFSFFLSRTISWLEFILWMRQKHLTTSNYMPGNLFIFPNIVFYSIFKLVERHELLQMAMTTKWCINQLVSFERSLFFFFWWDREIDARVKSWVFWALCNRWQKYYW